MRQTLFPGGDTDILVVGSYGYLLFDLVTGLRWSREGNLWPWPTAAQQPAISPDGKLLFIVERRARDSERGRITALDRQTGRVLASRDLPEGVPTGPLEVDQQSVRIRVGERIVEYKWTYDDALTIRTLRKPTSFEARPLYDGTANSVYLTWRSGAGVEAFELDRRASAAGSDDDCDQGESWEPVDRMPGQQRSSVETDVPSTGRIRYRLRSQGTFGVTSEWTYSGWLSAIGITQWPPVGTGTPSILHSYGTGFSKVERNEVELHNGIDLLASEGTDVRVVRGGVVEKCTNAGNSDIASEIVLEVQTGAAADDVDVDIYTHMWGPCVKGTLFSAGAVLGMIEGPTNSVSSAASHLHYQIRTAIDLNNSTETTLNPLSVLDSSQDPQDQDISLQDTGGDKAILQIVESWPLDAGDAPKIGACRNDPPPCGTGFKSLTDAAGDVDLIADISDLMASNPDLRVAPYEIEAWVKQSSGGEATIGSSTNPMTRLTLLEGNLGTVRGRACSVSADHPATMGEGMVRWPTYLSWVVTNSVRDGVSTADNGHCQFWRTDAKANSSSSTEITGSDADRANDNSEARFPDGRYELFLRVRDLRQDVGPIALEFVVDNFRPSLQRVRISPELWLLFTRDWTWSEASGDLLSELVSEAIPSRGTASRGLEVTVGFSEPMRSAAVGCLARTDDPLNCVLGPLPMTAVGDSADATEWALEIPRDTVVTPGAYSVNITAADLNGSPLEVLVSGRVGAN